MIMNFKKIVSLSLSLFLITLSIMPTFAYSKKLSTENYTYASKNNDTSDVKSSITVSGVNYYGTEQVDAFTLSLDYSNNIILFSNRINSQIHAGFRNANYFIFTLLDKNKTEKLNLEFKGNDNPSNTKFDVLNNHSFNIGDYIKIYHAEPRRLNFNGYVEGSSTTEQEQSYRITENGLVRVENITEKIKSSLTVAGVNYYGTEQVDAFTLSLDYSNNTILFLNRIKDQIHAGFRNANYFTFTLLDENKTEKLNLELKGNDRPNNSKFDILNNCSFNIGDYIKIYHAEPRRLNFSGYVEGSSTTEQEQTYRITENGLVRVDE